MKIDPLSGLEGFLTWLRVKGSELGFGVPENVGWDTEMCDVVGFDEFTSYSLIAYAEIDFGLEPILDHIIRNQDVTVWKFYELIRSLVSISDFATGFS